jgi:hypothetical protein
MRLPGRDLRGRCGTTLGLAAHRTQRDTEQAMSSGQWARRLRTDWRWMFGAAVVLLGATSYLVLELIPDVFAEEEGIDGLKERAEVRQGVRTAGLALVAGLVAASGAVYTALTFALSRRGQITERFTRAVDQLSSNSLAVRLGGIYALARIADESKTEYRPVIWILAAYVREHSRWLPPEPEMANPDDAPPEATEDIKAIVGVLRDRDVARYEGNDPIRILLGHTNLRGSHAPEIRLIRADLSGAQLQQTNLRDAELQKADLRGANLIGADLSGAKLSEARYDDKTTWPRDFDPEAAGAIGE